MKITYALLALLGCLFQAACPLLSQKKTVEDTLEIKFYEKREIALGCISDSTRKQALGFATNPGTRLMLQRMGTYAQITTPGIEPGTQVLVRPSGAEWGVPNKIVEGQPKIYTKPFKESDLSITDVAPVDLLAKLSETLGFPELSDGLYDGAGSIINQWCFINPQLGATQVTIIFRINNDAKRSRNILYVIICSANISEPCRANQSTVNTNVPKKEGQPKGSGRFLSLFNFKPNSPTNT